MIQGKLKNGFEYEIDPQNLDDYELLELMGDLEDNPLLVPKIINKILGVEQKDRLLDHLRDENGRVKTSLMEEAITEIMLSSQELKN